MEPYIGPKGRIQVPFMGLNEQPSDYDFDADPHMRRRMRNIFTGPDWKWNRSNLFKTLRDMRMRMPGPGRNENWDPRAHARGILNRLYDQRLRKAEAFNKQLTARFNADVSKMGLTREEDIEAYRRWLNRRLVRRNAGYQIPAAGSLYPEGFDPEVGRSQWDQKAYKYIYGRPWGKFEVPKKVWPINDMNTRRDDPKPEAAPAAAAADEVDDPERITFPKSAINASPRQFPFYG